MHSALDEMFYGRGNQVAVMKPYADNVLVLPAALKNTFKDELTGELDESFFKGLKDQFYM